jgi:hypothetical protein
VQEHAALGLYLAGNGGRKPGELLPEPLLFGWGGRIEMLEALVISRPGADQIHTPPASRRVRGG